MSYQHINLLYKQQDILQFKECWALEKIHGCLEAETIIDTKDGKKSIKEICESKYAGKVRSFDFSKNKPAWKNVKGHSVGGKTDEWLEICVEGGKRIVATANHRFWLPELKCWRLAAEIKEGDVVEIK